MRERTESFEKMFLVTIADPIGRQARFKLRLSPRQLTAAHRKMVKIWQNHR